MYKKETGFKHFALAAGYSFKGFRAALTHEAAFRHEVFLATFLIPLGLWLGNSGIERALLCGSVIIVLIVELLNSALEAIVDRVSTDHHELAGRAKDLGSAAVFSALTLTVVTWLFILADKF